MQFSPTEKDRSVCVIDHSVISFQQRDKQYCQTAVRCQTDKHNCQDSDCKFDVLAR